MKKYSVIVTLIALGLLAYIIVTSSPQDVAQKATTTLYQATAQISATEKPTARPTAKPTTRPTFAPSTSMSLSRLSSQATATPKPAQKTYILNKNTKVFHKPTCSSVNQMKESNKRTYTGTRQQVIDMGYKPCGRCHP